jgi:hypothetical protein
MREMRRSIFPLLILSVIGLFSCADRFSDGQLNEAKHFLLNAEIVNPNGSTVSLGKALFFIAESKGCIPSEARALSMKHGKLGSGIKVTAAWSTAGGGTEKAEWLMTKDGQVYPIDGLAASIGTLKYDRTAAQKIFAQ